MSFFTTAAAIIASQFINYSIQPQQQWQQEVVAPYFETVSIEKNSSKFIVFGNEVFSHKNKSAAVYLVDKNNVNYAKLGNSSFWELKDVAETNDGYLLTGISDFSTPYYKIWLAKTAPEGNIIWQKKIDKYNDAKVDKISVYDNNIILCGKTSDKDNKLNIFVAITDNNGNLLTDTILDNTQNESISELITRDNKIFILTNSNGSNRLYECDLKLEKIKSTDIKSKGDIYTFDTQSIAINTKGNEVNIDFLDKSFKSIASAKYNFRGTISSIKVSSSGNGVLLAINTENASTYLLLRDGYLQWRMDKATKADAVYYEGNSFLSITKNNDNLVFGFYGGNRFYDDCFVFGNKLSDEPQAMTISGSKIFVASKGWNAERSNPYLKLYCLNSNLEQQWTADFEMEPNDHIKRLVEYNGSLYILITTQSNNMLYKSKFVVFSDKGQHVQTIKFKTPRNIEINDFAIAQNGFVLTGTKYKDNANSVVWFAKLDKKFKQKWEKTLDGRKINKGLRIIATPMGYLILTQNNFSAEKQKGDIGLAYLDYKGNVKWQNNYGGLPLETGYDVMLTKDLGFLISGTIYKPAGQDGLVMKIDSKGNLIWSKMLEGNGNDVYIGAVENNDYYVLAGYTSSSGYGLDEILVSYLNKQNGNINQNYTLGGRLDERAKAIGINKNHIYLTGYTRSYGSGSKDNIILRFK